MSNTNTSSLAIGKKKKREIKIYSQEEKNELHQLALKGDLKARNIIVEINQGLSASFARKAYDKKYINSNTIEFSDLVSYANFGLIKAAEKFDINRGTKFSTYAAWWIKDSVDKCSLIEYNNIYLPDDVSKKLKKVKAIENILQTVKFSVFSPNNWNFMVIRVCMLAL